jgi:hypothetical protein
MKIIGWITVLFLGSIAARALLYLIFKATSHIAFGTPDLLVVALGLFAAYACRHMFKSWVRPSGASIRVNRELNLSWKTFGIVMTVAGLIAVFLVVSEVAKSGWEASGLEPLMLFASLSMFFAFRFHRLRATLGERSSLSQTQAELRRLLIGPALPALLWFTGTLLAIFGLVIFSVMHRHAV